MKYCLKKKTSNCNIRYLENRYRKRIFWNKRPIFRGKLAVGFRVGTPRKTNMEPKNGGLEDDVPFQTGDFKVPAVSFRGCI